MNLTNLKEKKKLKYSFIIQSFDMKTEVPNTLLSVSPEYQKFNKEEYEVILIQNPSSNNLTEKELDFFTGNLIFIQNEHNIPITKSINSAVKVANGENLIICIDGARILSPGILKYCSQAITLSHRAIVAFHGFHLGIFPQQKAISQKLYSKEDETNFLKEINFPNNPQALFFNASWAESSSNGYFHQMAESNCLMLPKTTYEKIGGFDERLNSLSGGLANLDLYNRVLEQRDHRLFFVLGEGSFHQYHGGDTTSNQQGKFDKYRKEYKEKTGIDWSFPNRNDFEYLGHIPLPSAPLFKQSTVNTVKSLSTKRPPHILKNIDEALSLNGEHYDYNIINIFAMHRSKSSYITRLVLNSTDAIVPGSTLGSVHSSNAKGHYEPHEIVALHNKILDELGANWRSLAPINFNLRGDGYITYCVNRLEKVLNWGIKRSLDTPTSQNTPPYSLLIKDPRLCRLSFFWDMLDKKRQQSSKQIILLDHPTKVARSLFKRDAIPEDWGELLWLRYNLDILRSKKNKSLIVNLHNTSEKELYSDLENYLDITLKPVEDWRSNQQQTSKTEIAKIFDEYCLSGDIDSLQSNLSEIELFINQRTELFQHLDKLMQGIK